MLVTLNRCLSILALLGLTAALRPPSTQSSTRTFPPIQASSLPNAHRLTAKVICGGLPDGEAGFRELQALGVKTVISVDGLMPDVELAHAHGMRYVHLPFGYNGVPEDQGEAIAKAVAELPGPVYVHCHHGKHRGPAAAAVACVDDGMLSPRQAEAVLETMGTGDDYKGLWQSVRDARPIDPEILRRLKVDFVERAKIPPLAEAMVTSDHVMDRLKLIQKSGWQTPANHPDLDPPHEALQLREMFVEIGRSETARKKPQKFRDLLGNAERSAETLRLTLGSHPSDRNAADAAMLRMNESCSACHRAYRD